MTGVDAVAAEAARIAEQHRVARACMARLRPLPIRPDTPMSGDAITDTIWGVDAAEARSRRLTGPGPRQERYEALLDRGWDPTDPTTRPGAR